MTRRKPHLPFVFIVLALVEAGALAGCPSTATTTTYTPITGVEIDSASLVAGHGCGTGPDQVYMYAVVLSYTNDGSPPGPPAYSGVFDCYSNAILSNLVADDAGYTSFDVSIYAYNEQSFPAQLACPARELEAGSAYPLCPGDQPSVFFLNQGTPTWTTTCTATQTSGVPQFAVCGPLVGQGGPEAGAGEASPTAGMPITVDTAGFVLPEGGAFDCTSSYTSAQATYKAGSQSATTPVTSCSTPLTLSPTIAGLTYAITVQLFQGTALVGTVSCQATASATSPTIATCGPVVQ